MISACGVVCSDCPAYLAKSKGTGYQQQLVDAWHRIYGLNETPEHINCGGCLGTDEELFYTSRNCSARQCCRSKGFSSCGDCPVDNCQVLEEAQSVWDGVPALIDKLSPADFEVYARLYCGHRKRIEEARTGH